ncbi:amidase signature domain-containing protein [Penicillium riverlandense]|uniref:amidase signature domain-containing protein n=1 Tax=Penicillium riverlandense TaxID=1903569 RepID=UPI002546C6FB|nr:amidase signature domain-containing protein [Penicillium riverlandense]KAJ5820241.1 amidase signature domain-containing protein [Penicillium riverlandense]
MGSIANSSLKGDWQEIVARKRRDQAQAIEGFLQRHKNINPSSDGTEICSLDHKILLESLSRGDLTAESVALAYINRSSSRGMSTSIPNLGQRTSYQPQTNCLTEVLFDQALRRSRELDEHFRKEGKSIGPLHGLPVSLKDQFNVKGFDSTLGYVGRAYSPCTEDATLVTILVRLGAVIIAKTNIPQSIMMAETDNPVWGLTVNPNDPSFTPGGSSGGESALLACKGSMIGWGTDIGGSIRGPSSMMGLYGLKPSNGRLPYYNVAVSTEGQEHVPSVIGPMTRSLHSLSEVTKAVIDSQPWYLDPRCIALPWRSEMYQEILSRPLTIGVIWDDGVVRVHPPIRRALDHLVEKLKSAGHETITWDPTGHADFIKIQDQYYTADGGEDIRRDIAVCNEPFLPYVKSLVDRGEPISVYQYWQLNRRKLNCQKAYLDRWNNTRAPTSGRKVDVLLAPVMPHPAVPHNSCRWVGYTKVWNFLDYSALTFPVTAISKDIDIADPSYEPRNPMDEWNWNLYDSERMNGHPIGLQIIAQRLQEEKVLAAAKVFEELLVD